MSAASDRMLARADALEQFAYKVNATVRRIRERADVVALRDRPTYPTANQREQIPAAVALALSGRKPSSHRGDRVDGVDWPDSEVVWTQRWLSIHHRAPFSGRRTGGKLWSFTEDDVAALLALVREAGGDPVDHWTHDNGLSVRIR